MGRGEGKTRNGEGKEETGRRGNNYYEKGRMLKEKGKKVGEGKVEKAVPVRFSATETLDIGVDLGAPVMPAYREKLPYKFNGKIKKVDLEVAPTQPIIK